MNLEPNQPKRRTAVIAFAPCGCAIAADLDGEKESVDNYIAHGLRTKWVTPHEACELIKNADGCKQSPGCGR